MHTIIVIPCRKILHTENIGVCTRDGHGGAHL